MRFYVLIPLIFLWCKGVAQPLSPSGPLLYKYRLLGSTDSSWILTQPEERTIHFETLEPGDYSLELQIIYPKSKIQPEVKTFHFRLLRPWWKDGRIFALLICIFLAILYYTIRIRKKQLKQINEMRRNISTDLHDDIGATLSSINIYTSLAKEEDQNKLYLDYIQENTREVITRLDELVWSINPKNDNTEQLVNRMKLFAGSMLSAVNVFHHFDSDDRINELNLSGEVKRNLFLIFKEIINNVVKHSACRKCLIVLNYDGKLITLKVQDDGNGFDIHKLRDGRNGLQNIRQRAEQIKGKLSIDSSAGLGTVVTLNIFPKNQIMRIFRK